MDVSTSHLSAENEVQPSPDLIPELLGHQYRENRIIRTRLDLAKCAKL